MFVFLALSTFAHIGVLRAPFLSAADLLVLNLIRYEDEGYLKGTLQHFST